MEHPPFEDVFPIGKGEFPLLNLDHFVEANNNTFWERSWGKVFELLFLQHGNGQWLPGWWFQIYFIFGPMIMGNDPF